MTQITLTLTPYQEARLLDALTDDFIRWHNLALCIRAGISANGSAEDADMLKADAKAVLDAVREQIKANR